MHANLTDPPFFFHSAGEIRHSVGNRHLKPLHVHPEACEIMLVLEGQCRFALNQKAYTAGAGAIMLINAGDWHAEASVSGQPFVCLYLSCSGNLIEGWGTNQIRALQASPVHQTPEFERLQSVLTQILEENSSSYANKRQTVGHLLGLFLNVLNRSLAPPFTAESDHRQHVRIAKRFIEENVHTSLTLEHISTEVGLSKYYLAHIFKECTGISPIQYAIQCRIRASQHLLVHSALNIQQIARRTGYKSETHFQQAFKKATGKTPHKYRTANKEASANT
ncbi:AraC family transcriptional regulator [Planococcus shenhongbingii]|uniref:AraC family transcriptional regulator n=1 Tax=Planococcus shenhongbingii TaxID=3058398 RepID=A0ABT8NGC6_9BACL|nr:AraC family transcriptional regulator [Planococcus sp. N017]MDN7246943.1 AraC family transcriptional regulator [Planococcus sp. N017]